MDDLQKYRSATLRIVGIYALVGCLWIYLSDSVLALIVHDPQIMVKIAIFKGSFYIFFTSMLLYFLINRYNRYLADSEQALKNQIKYLLESETNLKQAEEVNTRLLLRQRAILDNLPMMAWLKDAEGLLEMVNEPFASSAGLTVEQCIGKTDLDIWPDKVMAKGYIDDDHEVCESGRKKMVEESIDTPLGTRWHTSYKTPLYDEKGQIFGTVGIVQDITDRKEAEEKLHISEEKFSTAFHVSPDSININRLTDGMYVEINEGFTAITGYTAEEVIGKTSLELNIWDNPDDRNRLAKELKECGIVNNLEATFRRKDGTTVDGLMSARVINIKGEPLILSISRDISLRKQTERLLKASEERYRTIFEQSLDAIFYTSPNGAIYKANPSACTLFGMTEQELCTAGRNGIMNRDDPRLAPAIEVRSQSRQINTELTCVRKDGEVFPVEVSSVITSEEPPQSFVIIRDISERKRIQQQLLQSQKMEAIGQLAGGVAHDFNNKLQAILGNTELAKMDLHDSDQVLTYLDEIRRAAEHSRDITYRLLAFSRQQVVTPQVLDANKIIADSLKSLSRLIGEHISISFEPCENLWNILMDPVQLDQVVMNLAINARDAMPDGGSLIIETRNTAYEINSSTSINVTPGDYVLITFSDTGSGMNKETLTRIFEPFFTTKEVGKGTGLGLATIYGIIRQNSGCIDVTSNVGYGTEFKVYIPRYSASTKEATKETDTIYTGSCSLLFVEDEDAVRSVISQFLRKIGYTVHEAATPSAALELARDFSIQIDLVLTDYVMPEMNGKAMMERILELRPQLQCIYASGFSTEHVLLSEEEHFIQKPYNFITLSGYLKRVLSNEEEQ